MTELTTAFAENATTPNEGAGLAQAANTEPTPNLVIERKSKSPTKDNATATKALKDAFSRVEKAMALDPLNTSSVTKLDTDQLYAIVVAGGWDSDTPTFDVNLIATACAALGDAKAFAANGMAAMKPKDAFEKLLCSQMLQTQSHLQTASVRLRDCETLEKMEAYERVYTKMARTFAAQMEALRKHRNGGKQTVTVQHVNVADGGQAIVGNVTGRGE